MQEYLIDPIDNISKYQFVVEDDTLDMHTKTTHYNVRDEWHAKVWNPSMLVVHVYIFLL